MVYLGWQSKPKGWPKPPAPHPAQFHTLLHVVALLCTLTTVRCIQHIPRAPRPSLHIPTRAATLRTSQPLLAHADAPPTSSATVRPPSTCHCHCPLHATAAAVSVPPPLPRAAPSHTMCLSCRTARLPWPVHWQRRCLWPRTLNHGPPPRHNPAWLSYTVPTPQWHPPTRANPRRHAPAHTHVYPHATAFPRPPTTV